MFPLPQQTYNHSPSLVAQGIISYCVFYVGFPSPLLLVIFFAYSSQLAATEHRTQLCTGTVHSHWNA